MKITIVGKGNVGTALEKGITKGGHASRHEVRFAGRDNVRDTVAWADVAILAVPWTAHLSITKEAGGAFDGKTVVDVSNVLTPSMELAIGFTTSGAEELQKMMPKAKVVKAFNTIFAQNMSSGTVEGEQLAVFLAGDDEKSKDEVRRIAEDIGFDCIDAGPLKSARYLEPMGMLNIMLGYGRKMGTDIGIRLTRKKSAAERTKAA